MKKRKALDYFTYDSFLCKFRTPVSYGARKKMFDMFISLFHPKLEDNVLDLGASPDDLLPESNLFDKEYPYKQNLVVASIEDCSNLVASLNLKKFIKLDGSNSLPFADKEFDLLHCNAVIEHVGPENQEKFLNECLRISKRVFITTPNRYFPVEMHSFIPFFHWLPWSWFQKIVRRVSKNGEFWSKSENLYLLSENKIKGFNSFATHQNLKVSFIRTYGFKSNLIIHN